MLRTLSLLLSLGVCAAVLQAQTNDAREHQRKGIEFAHRGEWRSAEAELRQAVALAPDNAQILATLGGILGSEQNIAEAAVYLEKAVQLAPDNAAMRCNLARSQWRLGKLPEARRNLETALKTNPRDPQAAILLGIVSENMGDYVAAADVLSRVRPLLANEPMAAAALASAYYRTGKTAEAHAFLESLGSAGPEVIFAVARIATDTPDSAWAEKMLLSIRPVYPDPVALGYELALAQYHQDHFADTQKTLSDLVAGGHASSDVHSLLGWCLQKQGKTPEAAAELEFAIRLEPDREVHYLDLARIYLASAEPGTALRVARRTVEKFPASDEAWLLKGSIETGLQNLTDAVKSYSSAVKLNSNDPEPARALGTAQWLAGLVDEAKATLDELLRRFPRVATNYAAYGALLVGDSASAEGDAKRGAELLETALTLDPNLAEPHYHLGNLALAKGDLETALRHLEIAVKLNPASSKSHFALSKALRRQGRAEESAREVRLYQELKTAEERTWKRGDDNH